MDREIAKRYRITCARCGEDLDDGLGRLCQACTARTRSWCHHTVYLLLEKTGEFNVGGHFAADVFKRGLRDEVWPNGMIVEKWHIRHYQGTYRVEGERLVKIDRAPKGDGVYLVLTEDGQPAPLPEPFVGQAS